MGFVFAGKGNGTGGIGACGGCWGGGDGERRFILSCVCVCVFVDDNTGFARFTIYVKTACCENSGGELASHSCNKLQGLA